jgi:hypothetical protein
VKIILPVYAHVRICTRRLNMGPGSGQLDGPRSFRYKIIGPIEGSSATFIDHVVDA